MRTAAAAATALLLSALAVGCSSEKPTDDPADDSAERQDGENDTFVSTGKADSNGIESQSWAAQCVLNAANQATLAALDDDMSLWGTAAESIVKNRPYATIEALDAAPWVGFYAFHQISKYATANGLCPKIAEEYVPPGEEADIEAVTAAGIEHLRGQWDAGERPARRDAHPKAHGCVKAHFEVNNTALPTAMRVGLFAKQGQKYPAWIRFSNGSFTISPDPDGDIRGMAIKLMDVPGEKVLEAERDAPTQDFLLINTPVLMVRNAADYVEFSQKAFDGNPVSFFLKLDPDEWHFRELAITLKVLSKNIASPLLSRYWSTTPYKLGDSHAVKYSARPCNGESDKEPDDAGEDYLAKVLADSLATREACFEFLVQAQTDAGAMPVEDPSIEWDARKSPYLVAGRIMIPSQTFDGEAQKTFCENLSFNPWHSLPEHAPIGGINRVRRTVYDAIAGLRHSLNMAPRVEPTSHEIPPLAE